MKAEIQNQIRIRNYPPSLGQEVKSVLTFRNPAYDEAEKMGRWTGRIPMLLRGYVETTGALVVPRGFGRQLEAIAGRLGVPVELKDQTWTLPEVDFTFNGALKSFQEEAVADVLSRDIGTLSAATGSGKTVMALAVIAERKQPALVVVHTKELLHQWVDRIETFLEIPAEEVGMIGAGKKALGSRITVGIVNSVYKLGHEIAPSIGHLVVDECHRAPSRTFTEAVSAFDSRYLLGLSATPWRRDKLSRLIYWYIGDLAHEIKAADLQADGDILRAEVIWRETAFRTRLDASEEYSKVLSELTKDPARNRLIAEDVARNRNGIALVLSDRREHVNTLAELISARNVPTATLTGDMNTRARAEALDTLRAGKSRVLVATGQLIGEGFDLPAMSTLFLATPIRFDGRVLQYIGRVLRSAPGKDKARVQDYVDVKVGPLKASARARDRIYGKHGMEMSDGDPA